MTLTIKPWMAAIAIALIGALVGLGIGQITQAAGGGGGKAQIKKINKRVSAIDAKLGDTSETGTISDELRAARIDIEKAKDLALVVCTDVDPQPSICHNINRR